MANSYAASGAYWLASQASEVVVAPGGMVGSIGVYQMHIYRSEERKQLGRTVTLVTPGSGKSPATEKFIASSESAKRAEQLHRDDQVAAVTPATNPIVHLNNPILRLPGSRNGSRRRLIHGDP